MIDTLDVPGPKLASERPNVRRFGWLSISRYSIGKTTPEAGKDNVLSLPALPFGGRAFAELDSHGVAAILT
ncbi:hypothetical protein USDA257_c10970 [Sinorhizobium fredii USDA 257]|uniref:Uncharacterized protein n=1 Tax=Sinorhizobium fredii (strain USDA 257) TaxID=1185652 RepID=I3X1D2_SINF2|nr:hypothetical protein USDA257_c10970 [Sinorhizobium fredii USDA 257]